MLFQGPDPLSKAILAMSGTAISQCYIQFVHVSKTVGKCLGFRSFVFESEDVGSLSYLNVVVVSCTWMCLGDVQRVVLVLLLFPLVSVCACFYFFCWHIGTLNTSAVARTVNPSRRRI